MDFRVASGVEQVDRMGERDARAAAQNSEGALNLKPLVYEVIYSEMILGFFLFCSILRLA